MDGGTSTIIMMVVFFGIFYFMLIRPQKKKDKEIRDMRNNLSVGDDIITIGGIHGKIVKINDEIIGLELSHKKQRVDFSKWAVGSVEKKGKDIGKINDVIEEDTTNEENDVEDKKKDE